MPALPVVPSSTLLARERVFHPLWPDLLVDQGWVLPMLETKAEPDTLQVTAILQYPKTPAFQLYGFMPGRPAAFF